jgi:3-hydroxymyristoyl/3-hydroxydecanoyl-(acyl carrier protein) dehydratase
VRQRLYQPEADRPHYCLSHGNLDLLDSVFVHEGGGSHGRGYLYATRQMNPDAWYFTCHFYQDPVMPGSLGVEGAMQAMQLFALHTDLGRPFTSPHFEVLPDYDLTWKYRGQIVRDVAEWSLEVHITHIEQTSGQVIVMGDASVWRAGLRIYEIRQLGLRISET